MCLETWKHASLNTRWETLVVPENRVEVEQKDRQSERRGKLRHALSHYARERARFHFSPWTSNEGESCPRRLHEIDSAATCSWRKTHLKAVNRQSDVSWGFTVKLCWCSAESLHWATGWRGCGHWFVPPRWGVMLAVTSISVVSGPRRHQRRCGCMWPTAGHNQLISSEKVLTMLFSQQWPVPYVSFRTTRRLCAVWSDILQQQWAHTLFCLGRLYIRLLLHFFEILYLSWERRFINILLISACTAPLVTYLLSAAAPCGISRYTGS